MIGTGAVVVVGLIILIMLVFPVTRSMLAWFFGRGGPAMIAVTYALQLLGMLFHAHILIIKNFAPRRVVLPSLQRKGTRIR